jgi:transcriptional regulator with XRE-family HTH domain
MRERSHTVSQMAAHVGVSQSYLSQLLNGDKAMDAVSDLHLRRFSAYLGIPPIGAFVLAGRLELADFIEDIPTFEEGISRGLASISSSPSAAEAGVDLTDLERLPVPMKVLIVLLHQRAQLEDFLRPMGDWWLTRRIKLQV